MRIAIDYRLVGYSMRGMAKYCKNITDELLRIPNGDIEFFLYVDERADISKLPSNIKYRVLHTSNFVIGEQVFLPYYLRKDKIDRLWSPHNTFPLLAPKSTQLFATWHDLVVMEKHMKTNSFLWFLKNKYYCWVMRGGWRKLKGVATVSEYSKQVILEKFPFNEVVITSNCISDFISLADENMSRISYSREDFFFTVSGDSWYKNLSLLLSYFKHHPDKSLKVAGLKSNSFLRHDCPSNVEILPFNISMNELIGYYCRCKAFLFVSKYEGFGIPVLEAMACGCKLIISNVASIPEVCGDNGKYIDPYSEKELSEAIDSIDKQFVDKEKYIRQLKKYSDWSIPAHKILELLLKS